LYKKIIKILMIPAKVTSDVSLLRPVACDYQRKQVFRDENMKIPAVKLKLCDT